MYYTVYQVTNAVNGKIYIGKHQTMNPDDGYMGSGIALGRAMKKYGMEAFSKQVLFVFTNEDDMNRKEIELVTEEFVARSDTYNMTVGGEGGPHFKGRKHSAESRSKMGRTGKILSEEARNKIRESNRNRGVSDETKRKISLSRKRPEQVKPSSTYSRTGEWPEERKQRFSQTMKQVNRNYVHTDEHKKRISESVKATAVIDPRVRQTIVCPHCQKEGQALAMKRYHFDRCKTVSR